MVLLLPASGGLHAQESVRRHEVSISAGALPGGDYYTYYDIYPNHKEAMQYRGDVYSSGAWTAAYGYNIKKWLCVGGAVTWYGEFSSVYSNVDNSKIRNEKYHLVTVMPTVRMSWLNREWVKMYSSLGLGIGIEVKQKQDRWRSTIVAGKISPVGIIIGRSLYGFAELSIGTQGFAIVGMGYRFNSKMEKR